MAGLNDHPIAERIRRNPPASPAKLSLDDLKALVMECGADDCGVVSLDDPLLQDEAVHARPIFPTVAHASAGPLLTALRRQI